MRVTRSPLRVGVHLPRRERLDFSQLTNWPFVSLVQSPPVVLVVTWTTRYIPAAVLIRSVG